MIVPLRKNNNKLHNSKHSLKDKVNCAYQFKNQDKLAFLKFKNKTKNIYKMPLIKLNRLIKI
jgi:hypothetical protein